jgi:AcrR family transcriptional regulator
LNSNTTHPGRPRDPRLDEAILAAALEVFLELGYVAATFSEIARRAGVGTPALYRRWPSKTSIAIDVVVREQGEEPIPNTGSIRDDLVEFMRLRIRVFSTPLFHQVMVPVLLEAAAEPRLKEAIGERFIDYRQPLLARIRDAVDAGDLRVETDPHRLLDVLMGTVSMPLLFSQPLPAESDAEQIVDQVLGGYARRVPTKTDAGLTQR